MRGELRLTSNGVLHGVHLDGVDISSSLRSVALRLDPSGLPAVVLDVMVHDMSADLGRAQLCIPDETRDLLLRFGWTPPQDDVQQGGVV